MVEEWELDGIETRWPAHCPHCTLELPQGEAPDQPLLREQVWEPPPVRAEVIEHRFSTVTCPGCPAAVRATRPTHVPPVPSDPGW